MTGMEKPNSSVVGFLAIFCIVGVIRLLSRGARNNED